jgi:hypothetical protein
LADMSTQTDYATLTTVFTAPASCRTQWTYEGSHYNAQSEGLLVQQMLAESLDTECYPPSFTQAGRAPDTFLVYSPGVCPAGYASANIGGIGETTTIVTCCPRYGKSVCVTVIPILMMLQCVRLHRVHVRYQSLQQHTDIPRLREQLRQRPYDRSAGASKQNRSSLHNPQSRRPNHDVGTTHYNCLRTA